MPLVDVLKSMAQEGIAINSESLHNYSTELETMLVDLEISIKSEAGMEFNIDSPKQLGQVLFDVMELSSKAKKTKTGQYATGEDVLQKLKNTHSIIPMILDYRQLVIFNITNTSCPFVLQFQNKSHYEMENNTEQ